MSSRARSPQLYYRYLLLLLSSVLGALSFPGLGMGWLAWISLLPSLVYGERVGSRREFLWGVFLSEGLKWLWLVIWLRHVSWIPTVGIALVMAAYQCVWYAIYWRLRSLLKGGRPPIVLAGIMALALCWALMEWIRTRPFGMPGNPLNVTQWKYPEIIAICSIIGGYGLSAVIVSVNLLLFRGIIAIREREHSWKRWINPWWIGASLTIVLLVLIGVGGDGRRESSDRQDIKVAFIQPYQPAYRSWTMERMVDTVETVFRLTGKCSDSEFDLMLWPEGTLPLPIYHGSDMDKEVSNLVSRRVMRPLLLGNQLNLDGRFYNAVLKYNPDGSLSDDHYAKNYLVPFGEFVPWRSVFGFLDRVVPLPGDFDPGKGPSIISLVLNNEIVNISALVCYEDCFPDLAVKAARDGAEVIYVATYDIWYGKELAAYMHAAHAVIRAAETGIPFLRCGSGGWSGYIDGQARIRGVIQDQETGSIYFRGFGILDVQIPDHPARTFFVRHYEGIILAVAIGAIALLLILLRLDSGKKESMNV